MRAAKALARQYGCSLALILLHYIILRSFCDACSYWNTCTFIVFFHNENLVQELAVCPFQAYIYIVFGGNGCK